MEFDDSNQDCEFSEKSFNEAVKAAKREILQGYSIEKDSTEIIQRLNFVQDISKEAYARGAAVADALCAAKGIIQALRVQYNKSRVRCEQDESLRQINVYDTSAKVCNEHSSTHSSNTERNCVVDTDECASNNTEDKELNGSKNNCNSLVRKTEKHFVCYEHLQLRFMEQLLELYTQLYLRTPVPTLSEWRCTLLEVLCCAYRKESKDDIDASQSKTELAMLLKEMYESSSDTIKQLIVSHLSVINKIRTDVNNENYNVKGSPTSCNEHSTKSYTIANKSEAEIVNDRLLCKNNINSHVNEKGEYDEDEDDDSNGEHVEQHFKCFLQACMLLARRRLKSSSKNSSKRGNTQVKSVLVEERNSKLDSSIRNEMIAAIQRYMQSADIDW